MRNVVERLSVLHLAGPVELGDLPIEMQQAARTPLGGRSESPDGRFASGDDAIDLRQHLAHVEREIIVRTLQSSRQVVTHAALRLSVPRTTLIERMRRLGLSPVPEPLRDPGSGHLFSSASCGSGD